MIHIRIDPVLFQWGDITVGWHGLWLAAGLFVGYQAFVREGLRTGTDRGHLSELFLWMFVVGYLGARLLHVLHHWEVYAAHPASILAVHKGGLRLYGGLIGGTIAMVAYVWYKNLSFWSLADAMAMAIPVGEIVGRVGCTINGDIWGVSTHSSWGLVYWHPNASIPAYLLGVPTFPAPTMLQVWNAGLLILLLVLRKRSYPSGFLFSICMIVYSVGRFIVSIWQPQERFLLGLGQTQIVSLGLIGIGIFLLLYLGTRMSSQPLDKKPVE